MPEFLDERLDDPVVLEASDHVLRPLAQAGARLRRDAADARAAIASLAGEPRPRAVIAVGPEARLLRAVLEPVCPVPFVAWPSLGLPGWVGPLDLVVVLGGGQAALTCAHEALRRGSRLLVTADEESDLARRSASRATTLLPVSTNDPLTAAIVALIALHEWGWARRCRRTRWLAPWTRSQSSRAMRSTCRPIRPRRSHSNSRTRSR